MQRFCFVICVALLPLVSGAAKPNPKLPSKWHLDAVGAPAAWRTTQGASETIVGVVDSGVDYTDAALSSNMWRNSGEINGNRIDDDRNGFVDDIFGWDFVRNRNDVQDRSGHGTLMASIIASSGGDGHGHLGVCPRCSIMALRFLNYEGMGDTEDAIKGIYYGVRMGARVLNVSFAGEGFDQDLMDAIKFADLHDVLVLAAASNDALDNDKESIYPAKFNLPNLITVAASTRKRELWPDSNWGKRTVHLAAPGEDITGIWEGRWDTGDGTSDATAVASGVAGLVRSAAPGLSARQIKNILMATVKPSEALADKTITGGVIDAAAAVECATSPGLECLGNFLETSYDD